MSDKPYTITLKYQRVTFTVGNQTFCLDIGGPEKSNERRKFFAKQLGMALDKLVEFNPKSNENNKKR